MRVRVTRKHINHDELLTCMVVVRAGVSFCRCHSCKFVSVRPNEKINLSGVLKRNGRARACASITVDTRTEREYTTLASRNTGAAQLIRIFI